MRRLYARTRPLATRATMKPRALRYAVRGAALLALLYLVLLVPDADPPAPRTASARPFAWNQDERWRTLATRFEDARAEGCDRVAPRIAELDAELEPLVQRVEGGALAPDDASLAALETKLFELAPLVAACPARVVDYVRTGERVRHAVKRCSEAWDVRTPAARDALYRVLYGSRAALEEVLLQAPQGVVPALLPGVDEPSRAPSIAVHGVTLHSGDVLVSRGGAPTSALIARGHDLPGNFSHIALVHVDEKTGEGRLIEAHSETGVVVATFDEYLGSVKLRILAMRPRADLPELVRDPLLPHRAASEMLRAALDDHIPYDFTMAAHEHSQLFCSEVAAAAYEHVGVRLWPSLSTISSPGVASWLAAFGVTSFEFPEPADLEYDPQMRIVAEWRDPETLFRDHVDNAIVDARLEEAEQGVRLGYDRAMLPIVRMLKAWSVVLNVFGGVGPVPEGMSATAALRNVRFCADHERVKEKLLARAAAFEKERGYRAPYHELVRMGREALVESR